MSSCQKNGGRKKGSRAALQELTTRVIEGDKPNIVVREVFSEVAGDRACRRWNN
jgi:hypothetical protein